MESTKRELFDSNFIPPKLPFYWISSTFVVPLLSVFIPNWFSGAEISLAWRIVVALSIFSAMLIVSCITIVLGIYDLSFKIQVATLQQKHLEDRLSDIQQSRTEMSNRHSDDYQQTNKGS